MRRTHLRRTRLRLSTLFCQRSGTRLKLRESFGKNTPQVKQRKPSCLELQHLVTTDMPPAQPISKITYHFPADSILLNHLTTDFIFGRMWSGARGVSDHDLVKFDISEDLVLVRSGPTTYGTVIFGKIRLPNARPDKGEGDAFVHVR